jgi:hypothetical protein
MQLVIDKPGRKQQYARFYEIRKRFFRSTVQPQVFCAMLGKKSERPKDGKSARCCCFLTFHLSD